MLKREITKSKEYRARAEKIIPAGTQTFSKGITQYVQGVAPIYLQRGRGSHVFDVDGNEYIDYVMALGAVTLGYCYPCVDNAIKRQLERGISFTLPHPLEVELSELMCELIPCAEMVRFGKNGSDVTAAAVRIARAYTGREKIACCGYHGWQDWYIGSTTRSKGVPKSTKELTIPFKYNDIGSLEKVFADNKGEIAAVIMEPISTIEPEDNFLSKVKDLTHRNGTLLVFDEVVTGFRLALGGAQEYFGVIPDLATFGKGMANGMPISAVVGRKEIMEILEEVFFSFTFGGETLSLVAALATIEETKEKNAVDHIIKQGEKLKRGYNKLTQLFELSDYTQCVGLPAFSSLYFRDRDGNNSSEMKSLFQQEAIKRGILTIGEHVLSLSHSDEDVEKTLEVYADTLAILRRAIDDGDIGGYLEGTVIEPVIREQI